MFKFLPLFVLLLLIAYYFSVRCRKGHSGWQALEGWKYAHRGLHGEGVPENSLAAFHAAVDAGYGAELDVHLLKDGSLAVIHDSLLNRTTGQPGRIEDLTAEDLKNYRLEGTEECIPLFSQVLEVFAGKTPLIVELKPVDGNHAALAEAACDLLEKYEGAWCMESFDPRCVYWLKKNRPNVIRGQLAENFFKSRNDLPDYLRLVLSWNMSHFLTVPDFVAFKYADRNTLGNFICRNFWHAKMVSWTLRTREEYDTAVEEGWIPIFEGFRP